MAELGGSYVVEIQDGEGDPPFLSLFLGSVVDPMSVMVQIGGLQDSDLRMAVDLGENIRRGEQSEFIRSHRPRAGARVVESIPKALSSGKLPPWTNRNDSVGDN